MNKSIFFAILFTLIVCSCKNESAPIAGAQASHQDWAFTNFTKMDSINPILKPTVTQAFTCPITKTQSNWEARNVLNPSAIVHNDTVYLFYRAQDDMGTSRIGLATSIDGLNFAKEKTPVFYPDNDAMKVYEWNYKKLNTDELLEECKTCYFDGVEDPRIIESEEGKYIMTYTAYDGKTARLAIASSTDLRTWTKHGLVLQGEKYENYWSKSGAIVIQVEDSKNVAKKINGKYWMYFGDTNLFIATSDDLIHWEVSEDAENQKIISVLHPRRGYFDSRLVEPGPYAMYKEEGILLIYNGSNAANYNDTSLPKFTYAAGQALFEKNEPFKLIDRTDQYFIHPDKDYEKVGEVNEVCFVEGLVQFKNKWFLYYGTADSKIAVAVHDVEN
ncbi:glycosidase [Dokdonia sinensis]|uniref:Glycosidase n=1 Tax=Dokdonia sinensis TaxID=2479847 RepID=A0A3M0G9U5_9FLAO|nr:glycoside hydrolase family 130 protein [Dokdonia sinensis]RMB61027.1 glycosidase [Dokdonia sinensis]